MPEKRPRPGLRYPLHDVQRQEGPLGQRQGPPGRHVRPELRPDDLSKLGMSEEGRGVPVKVISPLVADQSEWLL